VCANLKGVYLTLSLFGLIILQMSDYKAEVNGMTYVCKSDGTALAESSNGDVVALRDFIELNGTRYVVKEIGCFAFHNCVINSIQIPSNVEVIREKCFSSRKPPCEVIFESGSKLREIGDSAFYDCTIKSVRIPSNVEVIGKECFSWCQSLCEVTFESGSKLREIGVSTFRCCAIKSVRIPSNVEVIGGWCFCRCQSLSEVAFESGSNLKEISKYAFFETGVHLDAIEIPAQCESLTGLSLVGLKFVTISKGNKSFILRDDFVMNMNGSVLIRYFGRYEGLTIHSCVESVSDGCFSSCEAPCEVTFESGSKLKEIGESAFDKCAIKSIQIPSNVEVIGECCFSGCKFLAEVTFKSGSKLKEIGKHVFKYCPIKSIRIPSNVEVIGEECFSWCESLCEVTFESGSKLKEIGKYAFSKCAIKSIRIPSNVELIGECCFSGCESLCEVTFESGSHLREIHKYVFNERLECVRVPVGFAVEYSWPKNCRIEYYEQKEGN
jgi:hypothetical protein